MDFSLPKKEKLKSSKTIEKLFLEGKQLTKFPLKIFFLPIEENETNKIAFAVPKRNFKSAVDRNRIKRQLREAFRLNKNILKKDESKKFVVLVLYLGKIKPQYDRLDKTMVTLLKQLKD